MSFPSASFPASVDPVLPPTAMLNPWKIDAAVPVSSVTPLIPSSTALIFSSLICKLSVSLAVIPSFSFTYSWISVADTCFPSDVTIFFINVGFTTFPLFATIAIYFATCIGVKSL